MPSAANSHERAQLRPALVIRFPQGDEDEVAQDDEWCEVDDGEAVTKIRFHDYAQILSVPGLYNQLFGGANSETKCISPQIMVDLLKEHLHLLEVNKTQPTRLRVLDFGAGNGMIGEEVRKLAAKCRENGLTLPTQLVGFDILQEAKLAAERDRPGVYDVYVAADITTYAGSKQAKVEGGCLAPFSVLISVSALSFGDASVAAFKAAVGFVQTGGLIVFNLKAGLLDEVVSDRSKDEKVVQSVGLGGDLCRTIQRAVDRGQLDILARRTYCHRFSVTGKPLYYVAVAALKHGDLE